MTEPILALIREYESDGAAKPQDVPTSYDVVYSGIPKAYRPKEPLTTYPIREVLDWQSFIIRKRLSSTAAGAYQMLRRTIAGLYSADLDRIFDAETQDAGAQALLLHRGWAKCRLGVTKPIAFADALSREWASLPVQWDQEGARKWVKRGQSYYAGDGLNAAHCPPLDVVAAIEASLGPVVTLASLAARVAVLEARLEGLIDGTA
jgi:muramidase (phage lysozyme)